MALFYWWCIKSFSPSFFHAHEIASLIAAQLYWTISSCYYIHSFFHTYVREYEEIFSSGKFLFRVHFLSKISSSSNPHSSLQVSSPFTLCTPLTWTIFFIIHPWICIWVTISCRTYFEFRIRSWRFHILGLLTFYLQLYF